MTAIVAYGPTEGDDDENKVSKLRQALESVTQHDVLAVFGESILCQSILCQNILAGTSS